MKVALIPCVATEWREAGRLLGRVELSPGGVGDDQTSVWAEQLKAINIEQLLHAPDELATHTAKLLARKLVVPTKAADSLAEVDLGLWSGLTEEQLRSRYASAHRELCDAPMNVSPPGGEPLGKADARLRAFLKKQAKRNGSNTLGLVMRPLSLALARCLLEGQEASAVWDASRQTNEPVIIEIEPDVVVGKT